MDEKRDDRAHWRAWYRCLARLSQPPISAGSSPDWNAARARRPPATAASGGWRRRSVEWARTYVWELRGPSC